MGEIRHLVAGTLVGLVIAAMVTSPAAAVASPADTAPVVELQLPSGAVDGIATSVNKWGTVVGYVEFSDGRARPVTWDARGTVTLLPTSPWNTEPTDIDDRGVIYGFYIDGQDFPRAVAWDRARQLIQMPSLAPAFTMILGSNAAGTAVGQSATPSSPSHAVRWNQRWLLKDLGTLPGDTQSAARAVNDAGVIVGESGRELRTTPVMWDATGQIHALASTGDPVGWMVAINNAGTILGVAGDREYTRLRAVRWDPNGGLTILQLPSHATGVLPVGLNERGTIIGTATFGDSQYAGRGVRWDSNGRPIVLDPLSDTDRSEVRAINEHDVAIGVSESPTGSRAVYWDAMGRTHAMASLPGCTSSSPWSVNDRGVVVGYCWDATTGHRHAVLWRIPPDPVGTSGRVN